MLGLLDERAVAVVMRGVVLVAELLSRAYVLVERVRDQVVHQQPRHQSAVEDCPARQVLDVARDETRLVRVRQRHELCGEAWLPCEAPGEYFEPLNCTLNDLENIELAPFLIM